MADVNLKDFVETKLTKGELVDIVLNDMRGSLEKQMKELDAKKDNLRKSLTFKDVAMLFGNDIKVDIGQHYYSGDDEKPLPKTFSFTATVREVTMSKMTKALVEKLKSLHDLETEYNKIQKRLWKLNEKGTARVEVLKSLVERTPEGVEFLKMLDGIKIRVDTKLLTSGK